MDRDKLSSGLILQILNGTQAGVQTALKDGRYLIGGDPGSCDLIVDAGSGGQHLALLVVEEADLLVRALSGEIRRDGKLLNLGEFVPLDVLSPLTIGKAHLAVGVADGDFDSVALPVLADEPDEWAVELSPRSHWAQPTSWLLGLGGIGVTALAIAATLVGMDQESSGSLTGEKVDQIQQILQDKNIREVTLQAKGSPAKLHATGYVNDAKELRQLNEVLANTPAGGVVSVQLVDELRLALTTRIGNKNPQFEATYVGGGKFRTVVDASDYRSAKQAIEGAFRDLPGLTGTTLVVSDIVDAHSRDSSLIHVTRLPGSTGRVAIAGEDLPMLMASDPDQMFVEVRYGQLPSVVTREGKRLFVGAAFGDGSQIVQISRDGVLVTKQGRERLLVFSANRELPRLYRPARKLDVAVSEKP